MICHESAFEIKYSDNSVILIINCNNNNDNEMKNMKFDKCCI